MTIFRPQNEKEKKSKCDKSKIKKSQRPKFERHQEDTSLDDSLFTSRSILMYMFRFNLFEGSFSFSHDYKA